MAVKGETDPAARAHIHPTSSRKPAVVEATLRVGGAPKKILSISSSSRDVHQKNTKLVSKKTLDARMFYSHFI